MTLQRRAPRARSRWAVLALALAMMFAFSATMVMAAPPKIVLDQCRNGSVSAPSNCVGTGSGSSGWVNGNVGAQQGHLLEGYSIPYRARITGAPTGVPITVTIGYDIKHSGKHAIDFLTHFDRLDNPDHETNFGGHAPEQVLPTDGTSVAAAPFFQADIPAPTTNKSVNAVSQPVTRFNSLPAAERKMTLFAAAGSSLDGVSIGTGGDLNASQSEATINVTFTLSAATGGNAVLAWGGHIARNQDWGVGESASSISGSPYHMRLKMWTAGNVGNQDRSLSTGAVFTVASNTSTQPYFVTTFSVALSDSATVTGNNPSGTVTFRLYGPTEGSTAQANCTAGSTTVGTGGLLYENQQPLSSGTATSGSFSVQPTTTTTYAWTALYSGDGNNEPSQSPCSGELVTVTPPSVSGATAPPAP